MITVDDEKKFALPIENEVEAIALEFMTGHPAIYRDIRNTPEAQRDLHSAIRKGMRYVLELEGVTYD